MDDYQHDSSLRQAIEAEGLYWQDIPVVPGEYTEEAIQDSRPALEKRMANKT